MPDKPVTYASRQICFAANDDRRGILPGLDIHAPRRAGRCFERCPDVLRETDHANRLRALVARLLDRLPPDDPLVEDLYRCLE